MLKIGDFSKLSRISIRMLRHYDEMGLLMPASTDPFTGYRYYNEAQLPNANRIAALKDMGFSLSSIIEILKNYDDPIVLKQYLQLKQQELKVQEQEVFKRLRLLESTIKQLGKDDHSMNYNVTLKELPSRYVASVRSVLPAYEQEGLLWQTMYKETASQNLQTEEPCYPMAIFHDKGYKESDVDVEVQETVKGSYEDTEHVRFKTMPAVCFASATYQGSYDLLREVNSAVANWVRDNDYEFKGASFCIYHVSPAQTNNPDELVTEVCFPVIKKK